MATINMCGTFKNPWAGRPAEEKRRIEATKVDPGAWHPSTDDFEAVCGRLKPEPISSFTGFLNVIRKQNPGTINRINIWSHANPGLIAFSGEIDRATGQVTLYTADALDDSTWGSWPKGARIGSEDIWLRRAIDLRNRFAVNAEIAFYMCGAGDGGLGKQLLQSVANVFAVTAKGPPSEVMLCAFWDSATGPIKRGFASLKRCGTSPGEFGFAHLEPGLVSAPKRPYAFDDFYDKHQPP
jgi:hypothetical protein